jgi:hypothetical protein|tara:strand:- start:267 stop:617 length:351 start_codon:yes stop_codon:yes gene_type:complete
MYRATNKEGTMLTKELHNTAMVAAEKATNDYIKTHGDFDCCGFAWVTAYVNGASKLGKSFKAVGFDKAYGGGWQLWNPSKNFTQSINAKEAGAQAYVDVIRTALPTVKIYASSRMD